MPNRYTRDELCVRALNTSQVGNLIQHDMPDGSTINAVAFTPLWLQEIIDFWLHMAPFSATIAGAPLTIPADTSFVSLPADFIVDVRNGLFVRTIPTDALSVKRAQRLPFQKFLNRQLANQKTTNVLYPKWYCIASDDQVATQQQRILVSPTPDISVPCTLWYYKLPPVLTGTDRPKMPSDYVCLEYLRIRCLEWARIYEPGTAQEFAKKVLAGMKAAGLMNEPEDDEIPFDDGNFFPRDPHYPNYSYAWLGPQ